jgi:hypothetical protein
MCCLTWEITKFLFNAIIISILTGIVAAWSYDRLIKHYASQDFKKHLSHLRSPDADTFDWTCHAMQESNGRLINKTPDGSTVNIQHVEGNRLKIRLKQSDNRIWEGELNMQNKSFGTLFAKYVGEHEYRFMNVYIGVDVEGSIEYDYIFTMPTNDNLYYMEHRTDNKIIPHYNYGREVFRRKKS